MLQMIIKSCYDFNLGSKLIYFSRWTPIQLPECNKNEQNKDIIREQGQGACNGQAINKSWYKTQSSPCSCHYQAIIFRLLFCPALFPVFYFLSTVLPNQCCLLITWQLPAPWLCSYVFVLIGKFNKVFYTCIWVCVWLQMDSFKNN